MEGGEASISWRMIFPENRWPPFRIMRWEAVLPAIIRRNLRNASMMGICPFTRQDGLERVKKTLQVAGVGAEGWTGVRLARRRFIRRLLK
jgi:hypothetical protein